MNIFIYNKLSEIGMHAAIEIAKLIFNNPFSNLGLSTGSSPICVYDSLIELYNHRQLDFSSLKTFNLDEYHGLSKNNSKSFAYYMNKHLFNHININPNNINIFNGLANDVEKECQRYDEIIKSVRGIDLQLLGVGSNGHIGFNEPNNHFPLRSHLTELSGDTIKANSRYFESYHDVPKFAFTMGLGTIFESNKIILIAHGESKAQVVHKMIYGPITPQCPASILQLHHNTTVLLDNLAAKKIMRKDIQAFTNLPID